MWTSFKDLKYIHSKSVRALTQSTKIFSKVPRVKILFRLMLHLDEYLLLSYPTRKISIIVQISKSFVYFST